MNHPQTVERSIPVNTLHSQLLMILKIQGKIKNEIKKI